MSGAVAAIVVAGGRGVRAGGELPKQYRTIGGIPVLRRSLLAFTSHPDIHLVQPVIHPDDERLFQAAADALPIRTPVNGGATRQASVFAGLEALAADAPEIVLVHDAARPFASAALISRAIAAGRAGAAIPGLPVSDTVKAVDASGRVVETLDRGRLRTVQTPQAFAYPTLLAAHRKARAAGRDDFTDDAALAEWAGMAVGVFAGEAGNTKLTTAEDFARAELENLAALGDVRTGSATTSMPSPPGTTSCSEESASRTTAALRATRTPMSPSMRWSMRSSARWPTAISGCISRRATRNGAAHRRIASSPSRSSACASAAA